MGNNGSGTLVLPNDIFFSHVSESLAEGKTVTFIVKGCSMYPFFRNGKDRVCMAGYDGRELRKGEVILFRYRGKYVMHRIYGVETDPGGTTVYRTVGDGNVRGRENGFFGLRPQNDGIEGWYRGRVRGPYAHSR